MQVIPTELEGYQLLHGSDSYAPDGFKIRIYIEQARPIDDEDGVATYKAVKSIEADLRRRTVLLDSGRQTARKQEREDILNCFMVEGITPIYVEEVPNGYCGDWCCADKPWFRVTTPFGHVIIGWRKRVINIDWSETCIHVHGRDLFIGENTTVEARYIHAWGYDKATQYLKTLYAHFVNSMNPD